MESDTARKKPPQGRGAGINPTQVVVERRVTQVFALVVAGLQTWEMSRAVAEGQLKERREREKARERARAQGAADPDAEALLDVPIVWGDEPMPKRTFEDYLHRARKLLDDQNTQLAGERGRMLAKQAARLDLMYVEAARGKKLYAALKAIELSIDTFGLRDFARGEAQRHALMQSAGVTRDGEDGGDPSLRVPTDPESRANAFAALAAAAVAANPELAGQLNELLTPKPPHTIMP